MKHILKFIKLPVKERMLLLEAFFFLFYSKFLLYFPFRYCIKKFKKKEQLGVNPTQDILTAVSIAVARANRVAFWKNVCLVKSFAARFMLERRNIVSTIYLGLQFKDGKEMVAHAWLISHEAYITPKGIINYMEIYNF